jgi:predicted membrane channel-forming protein YqfA (hemolysin III family)
MERMRADRVTPIFVLAALALWLAASFANTLTFWEVPGFRHVTFALLACAVAFGFVYLPIVLVRALAGRSFRRAASALAGMAVLLGCFAVSPLGPGAFRLDSWRLAYAKNHYLEQVRQSGATPRFVAFPWGATGGVMSGALFYWLVYDESGEIARPVDRSPAWRERAAAELPFFANPRDCREREVRHLDGHFHVLIVAC